MFSFSRGGRIGGRLRHVSFDLTSVHVCVCVTVRARQTSAYRQYVNGERIMFLGNRSIIRDT